MPSIPRRRSITGISEFDGMAVKFSARRDDRTSLWDIKVLNSAGDQTTSVFIADDEVWTEIDRMVSAAEWESQQAAKELAGVDA